METVFEFFGNSSGNGGQRPDFKMKETDILIIGGGAAGMMAAAGASESGRSRVVLVEKMPRPGRKIMVSGKGRCNLTNLKDWNGFSSHVHPKANFLKNAFYGFPSGKTMDFFRENGLDTVVERGDRVFPASYRSVDVVDALLRAAKNSGAEILTGQEAVSVIKKDGYFETALASGAAIRSGKVIIATGGLSYPSTGSTGDGYAWAGKFGHSIRQCFPSLTALVPAGYKILPERMPEKGHIDRQYPLSELGKSLEGNQLKNISLLVKIDGNEAAEEFGDLDFTDGGIEGPVGFKVSRKCVSAIMNGSKVRFVIDLKPAVDTAALERRVLALWDDISGDRRSIRKSEKEKFRILLGKLMPMSLTDGFLRTSGTVDVHRLAGKLKAWGFDIAGYVGYERCVITAGGVSTGEISQKTMESKLVEGLYFAGEVIDIDCDTGGYNLQSAFSTGMLAGRSAAAGLEGPGKASV